jgi:hypothetical protein
MAAARQKASQARFAKMARAKGKTKIGRAAASTVKPRKKRSRKKG